MASGVEGVTLGRKIRELLEERGWSHYKLAGMIGVPRPTITAIVNDKRIPRAETFIKLAGAFQIDIDILFAAAGFVSKVVTDHKPAPEVLLDDIKIKVKQLEKHLEDMKNKGA